MATFAAMAAGVRDGAGVRFDVERPVSASRQIGIVNRGESGADPGDLRGG
jgi:hypothetical protein